MAAAAALRPVHARGTLSTSADSTLVREKLGGHGITYRDLLHRVSDTEVGRAARARVWDTCRAARTLATRPPARRLCA